MSLAALVKGEAALTPAEDPYRERVLRPFFKHGKLVQIPAQRKKKEVILRELAEQFDPGQQYPEREVNRLLGAYHDDFFTLRRELIGFGLLAREKGLYWRVEEEATPVPEG